LFIDLPLISNRKNYSLQKLLQNIVPSKAGTWLCMEPPDFLQSAAQEKIKDDCSTEAKE